MATGLELKAISKKRLKTVGYLLSAKDWEAAVYLMGMTLEIALKSAACKALHLDNYPESQHIDDGYFKTHSFDRLLRISGCSDIFSLKGSQDAFDNWSLFTEAFIFGGSSGKWMAMRYDPKMLATLTEVKAKDLYSQLYEDENSILKLMTERRRW